MEPCKYEKEIGAMMEAIKNFSLFMDEIRNNHLTSIYNELKSITEKMSSRRPTWITLIVISFLCSMVTCLLTIVLNHSLLGR